MNHSTGPARPVLHTSRRRSLATSAAKRSALTRVGLARASLENARQEFGDLPWIGNRYSAILRKINELEHAIDVTPAADEEPAR